MFELNSISHLIFGVDDFENEKHQGCDKASINNALMDFGLELTENIKVAPGSGVKIKNSATSSVVVPAGSFKLIIGWGDSKDGVSTLTGDDVKVTCANGATSGVIIAEGKKPTKVRG